MSALEVVVVGGGIGGLAAAVALRRQGHRVTILEQASHLSEVGAAVGMGPNATAALLQLGIRDELESRVVYPRAWTRRRWQDGSVLGAYHLGEAVVQRFGHPFWMVHRARLHRALLDAAILENKGGIPAKIELRSKVTAIDSDLGEVKTAEGLRYKADLIVGADGIRSKVREGLFGPDKAEFSGNIAIRAQIPTKLILAKDTIRSFASDRNLETWLGPGAHLVHTLLDNGDLFNITACITASPLGSDSWFSETSNDYLLDQLSGWYPPLLEIISISSSVGRWDLYDREPLPNWTQGKACLLGDAAHPMLPYLGQGAAQTLEDAVALGHCVADIDSRDVASSLNDYEKIRRSRAGQVQVASRANRDVFHLPDGPQQQARDEELRSGGGDFEVFAWLWQPQMEESNNSGISPTKS